MAIKLRVHGRPCGQEGYPCKGLSSLTIGASLMERYIRIKKCLYIDKSPERVVYTYAFGSGKGDNFLEFGGRTGAYFAISLEMTGEELKEPWRIYRLLNHIYEARIKGRFIKDVPNKEGGRDRFWLTKNMEEVYTAVYKAFKEFNDRFFPEDHKDLVKPLEFDRKNLDNNRLGYTAKNQGDTPPPVKSDGAAKTSRKSVLTDYQLAVFGSAAGNMAYPAKHWQLSENLFRSSHGFSGKQWRVQNLDDNGQAVVFTLGGKDGYFRCVGGRGGSYFAIAMIFKQSLSHTDSEKIANLLRRFYMEKVKGKFISDDGAGHKAWIWPEYKEPKDLYQEIYKQASEYVSEKMPELLKKTKEQNASEKTKVADSDVKTQGVKNDKKETSSAIEMPVFSDTNRKRFDRAIKMLREMGVDESELARYIQGRGRAE